METAIEWMVWLLGVYLAIGLLFAVPFALWGAKRIDPAAAGGTWGFKVLVIPGAAIFWPLLLHRWMRRLPPPEERSAHRRAVHR